MTWTYTSTAPSASSRDQVRLYVGDTDTTDQQLTDEEIAFAVAEEGATRSAAALAADWIGAKYARLADKTVGDLNISYSQRSTQYRDLAVRLRSSSAAYALPYAGGISLADRDVNANDTDRVDPAFERGMLDNPEAGAVSEEDA